MRKFLIYVAAIFAVGLALGTYNAFAEPLVGFSGFRSDAVIELAPASAVNAASGNVANASAVATIPAIAGQRAYINGFQCTAAGSTAAAVVNLTVAGVMTGTMTYTFVFPAGATVAASPLVVNFSTPVPASAVNTAIVVTLPAGGAGNTNAACSAQGFYV